MQQPYFQRKSHSEVPGAQEFGVLGYPSTAPEGVVVVTLSSFIKAQDLKTCRPFRWVNIRGAPAPPTSGSCPPLYPSLLGQRMAWTAVSSPGLVGLSCSKDRRRAPRRAVEVGPVCFRDSKCLLMGCGLHRDSMPDRVVRTDWTATKACQRAGEGLSGAA